MTTFSFFKHPCGRHCVITIVHSTHEPARQVCALAGDIALCSWVRYPTLTVPLSTQEYKVGTAELLGKPNKLQRSDLQWTSIPSRGTRNTPSCFMLQKLDKLWQLWARHGSKASLRDYYLAPSFSKENTDNNLSFITPGIPGKGSGNQNNRVFKSKPGTPYTIRIFKWIHTVREHIIITRFPTTSEHTMLKEC